MPRSHPRDNTEQAVGREMPARNRTHSHNRGRSETQVKRSSKQTLEVILSSAPLIGEYEVGPLLRKVNEISDALISGSTDPLTLSHALRDAVLCAVKQFMAQRELRTLALTDDLTGLYNRRGFLAAATQQLKLGVRESRDALLFFADVDNLKQINDTYGHREGDAALAYVAGALERTFRDSDVVARLGGDEFTALAPNSSPYDEAIILRRLTRSLGEAVSNDKCYELSLSIGVARFDPLHPVSLGELLTQADQAMYERKASRPSSRGSGRSR